MPRGSVDRKRSLRMNCMSNRNGNFWPTVRELVDLRIVHGRRIAAAE